MKNYLIYISLFCFSLIAINPLLAKVELHNFNTPQQQKLYKKLSEELRCLVCQNQNLADSNAELALDMRQKTYQMVIEDKSESEIVDYWVTRYGDFVLYNPPFKSSTLILWVGPFLLLLLALYLGKKIVQGNKKESEEISTKTSEQSIQDHKKIQELLSDNFDSSDNNSSSK
jgi:cytochrome c-type biogenesis protein CcmH